VTCYFLVAFFPNEHKHNITLKDYLEDYIKNNVIKNGNGGEFYDNLGYGYKIIKKLFHMIPEMFNDFQVLVDNKGHIYFIDLDGQFKRARDKSGPKDCLAKIEYFQNLTITQ
jgi:hypothetical protein